MQCVGLSCACLGLLLLTGVPALAGPTYTVFSPNPLEAQGTTVGFGVNNAGDYVGSYVNSGVYYGFTHTTSGFSPVAPPDTTGTHPTGINNVNGIVGYYQDPSGTHGFVDQNGAYSTLNVAGATSTLAYGTNDNGQVVGYYVDGSGVIHGFSEKGGITTTIDAPGSLATYVFGVNNSGEMVGSYYDGTDVHGFTYDGGNFTAIDYPGAPITYVSSINNNGDVVGWYAQCQNCPQIGFILDSNGFSSIAPLYNVPTYLTGINDKNQIMVAIVNGAYQGQFQLDIGALMNWGGAPPQPEPPAVPEPGTHVLMAAGGVLLLALGRVRRRF